MKSFNVFVTLCGLMLLTSCASLSTNIIKDGELQLNGGRYKEKSWDASLTFERHSWFHELTLMYDLMYTELNESSPFFEWLSNSSQEDVRECENFYVFLTYHLSSAQAGRLARAEVQESLEDAGGVEVPISRFADFIKLHPDVEQLSLQLYDVSGHCFDRPKGLPAVIQVPNYKQLELEL